MLKLAYSYAFLAAVFLLRASAFRVNTRDCLCHKTVLYAKKPSTRPAAGFGSPTVTATPKFTGSKALRTAANNYDRLRKEFGVKGATRDVYVRSPLNSLTTFWFVGKVAAETTSDTENDDSSNDEASSSNIIFAVLSQKRLILDYAIHELRPQNFGGSYSSVLEIWLAPGDSEMDVVQNRIVLEQVKGSAVNDVPASFKRSMAGFNPEIYMGDEKAKGGLRVQRDEQGRPVKETFEVNQSV